VNARSLWGAVGPMWSGIFRSLSPGLAQTFMASCPRNDSNLCDGDCTTRGWNGATSPTDLRLAVLVVVSQSSPRLALTDQNHCIKSARRAPPILRRRCPHAAPRR
jgi:hypothetical protein